MLGYQFRRQRPIKNYIVDFVCLDLLLIIEVDGLSHENEAAIKKDAIRDSTLGKLGYITLRYTPNEVLTEVASVINDIENWIMKNAKVPPPGPRQRGKRK